MVSLQVNLAAQVCSHTVSAGMHTLVSLGKLPPSAAVTADFLKMVNTIFDVLNVRVLKGAVSGDFNAYCEQVQLWSVKGKFKKQPCFEALQQSLIATELMTIDLVRNGPFKFLLTGRINQDCLENFFSQVRGKGGHRFNPSAREFGFAYRALAANMLLKPIASANCKEDQDDLLVTLNTLGSQSQKGAKRKLSADKSTDGEKAPKLAKVETVDVIDINDFELPSTQQNVIAYVAGYLLRKIDLKTKCSDCFDLLTVRDSLVSESKLFCHYKVYKHGRNSDNAYGSLNAPSECLEKFIQRSESLFQKNIQKMLTKAGVLATMLQTVLKHVSLHMLHLCSRHSDGEFAREILTLYLRCRLHYYFKFETRKLFQKKTKASRKCSVLKHV
jgi:hypothetical protein